ncbi:MAG: EpsG family protein [Bacilli bacterium]
MLIYISMFIIEYILCKLYVRLKDNNKLLILLGLIIVLIPSIIAGLRDYTVGTDIKVYGEYMYHMSLKASIFNFLQAMNYMDILYLLTTYIISNIFHNLSVLLFVIQFLNCFVVFKAVKKLDRNEIPIAYFIYLTTLYFRQLNLLRQGLALSLCILAFSYLSKENNNRKYFKYTILAIFFHSSAIISLLIYFIYKKYNQKAKNIGINKKIITVILFLAVAVISIFFKDIIKIITQIGILGEKYTYNYFKQFMGNTGIDWAGFIFRLLIFSTMILFKRNSKIKNNIGDYNFYCIVSIIDMVFWNLNLYVKYMMRLAFYFSCIIFIFYIPKTKYFFTKSFMNQAFSKTLTIIAFLGYWYFKFVFQNAGNVYPYIFFK